MRPGRNAGSRDAGTVAPFRIDKWLWQARFFRSRTLAAEAVAEGGLRVNGQRIARPAYQIRPGDTLTFVQGGQVRLVRVLLPGHRRGPAEEAQTLYLDLEARPGGLKEELTTKHAESRTNTPPHLLE